MNDKIIRCSKCQIELTNRNSGDSDECICNDCYWDAIDEDLYEDFN